MRKTSIKIILRGWKQNKIYTFISIVSLIVGLTASMLLAGFVMHEYRIAQAIPASEKCYLIQTKEEISYNTLFSGEIADYLQRSYPEIKSHAVFRNEPVNLFPGKTEIPYEQAYSVIPETVDFFHFRMLSGDLKSTLAHENEIAVTRSFARKYLEKENPVGNTLRLTRYAIKNIEGKITYIPVEEEFRITAVIDDRQKTFLSFGILWGITENKINEAQGSSQFYAFVKLNESVNPQTLQQKISQDTLIQNLNANRGKVVLKPSNQLYFSEKSYLYYNELIDKRDPTFIYTSLSVALLILIVSCFNYINIYMTRTFKQLQNTSIQLVLGESKNGIYKQLIGESAMHTLLSSGIALMLIYRLLPVFNSFVQSDMQISDFLSGQTPLILLFLLTVIIFIPIIYIGLKLKNSLLSPILKRKLSRRNRLTRDIVIVQFSLSIILFILMFNIRNQMNYIVHSRPHSEEIIALYGGVFVLEKGEFRNFKEQLHALPEILNITGSAMHQNFTYSRKDTIINITDADDSFFECYDIPLAEGKGFSPDPKAYHEAIVNESFVRKMGWPTPIGKTFTYNYNERYTIIGVIADYATNKFTEGIKPMLIRYSPDGSGRLTIRIKKGSREVTETKLRELWQSNYPTFPPLLTQSMKEMYLEFHQEEVRIMETLTVFSWLSILLSALGLFGLAWFSVESRQREIGLRKINGATENQIVILLCRKFIKWILIAYGIAIPIGYYFSEQWLTRFIHKSSLSPGAFIMAGISALAIGLLTVIWQTVNAARENPVNVLKGNE